MTAPVEIDSTPIPSLPPRAADSHKGTYGRALLIGGARGMTGAIALAGLAALRGGAGLVQVATPRESQPIVAAIEPSYMTAALAADRQGRLVDGDANRRMIDDLSGAATAVAVGPGLSRSQSLTKLVGWLHAELPRPLVADADALNALSEQRQSLAQHAAPRILTPHPGEFMRLLGRHERIAPDERASLARRFAAQTGTVVVLKGHETCISDGERLAVNRTGNPGLATGGTGDVLTGLITALLCQGLEPYDAARLAVHLHGFAADLAADELGQVAMIASDLIRYLPRALQEYNSSTRVL